MARNYTKTLLVSANVGSIFEDPEKMLKIWLNEFLSSVKHMNPDFLAIHCQEVGGKNYEESMQHVNSFIKVLLASPEMQQFDKARVFLDEDFTAVDKFTALGSLYFIHQSVQNVQLYDFKECKFVPVKGREVLSGNIEDVPIKEKAKFPQEFFPDFKWSRKGFIRTRWNLQNTVFDLVNLHLFHDASNIVAMESSPSVYNGNRSRTLRHTIERFENDQYAKVPYFIFGDFNFRLDTHQLIKKLCANAKIHRTMGKKNDVSKLVFQDPNVDEPILSVEKKGFLHHKHAEVFSNNNGQWLHAYDTESSEFQDKLMEYDVTFPPSYPFSEDVNDGTSYMKTRCPSWCDRIMFTPDCLDLLYKEGNNGPDVDYNMMGVEKCMGDHKPIYLQVKLKHGAGTEEERPPSPSTSSECMSPPTTPLSSTTTPPNTHRTLQKVISINGEEIECSTPEAISAMNIHDFASFEKEEALGSKFMNTFRRREQSLKKRPSFKNMVKDVMRAESFLKALKHYSHRSDSETDDTGTDTDNGQSPKVKRSSRKRRSGKGRGKLRHQSTEEEPEENGAAGQEVSEQVPEQVLEKADEGESKPVVFSLDSTSLDEKNPEGADVTEVNLSLSNAAVNNNIEGKAIEQDSGEVTENSSLSDSVASSKDPETSDKADIPAEVKVTAAVVCASAPPPDKAPPTSEAKEAPPTSELKESPPISKPKEAPPTSEPKEAPPTSEAIANPASESVQYKAPPTIPHEAPPTYSPIKAPIASGELDLTQSNPKLDALDPIESPEKNKQPESADNGKNLPAVNLNNNAASPASSSIIPDQSEEPKAASVPTKDTPKPKNGKKAPNEDNTKCCAMQ